MSEQNVEILSQLSHELTEMGQRDWEMRQNHQNPQKKGLITKEELKELIRKTLLNLKKLLHR